MSESRVQVISPVKSFLAGGFGGACCIAIGHPFDTIKVRLQTMPHVTSGTAPMYYGTFDCVKKTVAADGVFGLYKGMGAPIAGVAPVFAICFFGKHEIWFAGMFSGIFSTAILAPGERIKCLLQVQSNAIGPLKYSGPVDVLRQLYREGGIRSIFKGTAATLLRDVPASGVYFLSYELMKDALRNPHSKNNELSVGKTLFAGGMAGIFNWLVAIPPDVLKSRLQSASEGVYPNGIRSVFSELIAKEGFLGLYRGMTPVMLRAFPANAVKLGDGSKYSVKLEHGDFSCGESQRCDLNSDNQLIIDHIFKYELSTIDVSSLDSLCSQPFVFSVDQPLLNDEVYEQLNIIYVNIESIQNVPETFHTKDHYTFVAALPLITSSEVCSEIFTLMTVEYRKRNHFEQGTKRQNSLLRDVLSKVSVQSTQNVQTDKKKTQLNVPKHERKTSVTGAKTTGRSASALEAETGERSEIERQKSNLTPNTINEQLTDQVQNTEAQQYLDAQSFIMLEFRLEKPLVKKRTLEEIDQKVSTYITEKQPVVKRHTTAEKAVKEYHKQIAEVANYLLMEFKVMFSDLIQTDQLPVDHECAEQMKHELYYSLNSSGKYFAFKERLKFAVIKIVREKFFRTKPFTDQEQLQLFLRDLFVYLVDEMHIGLKKVFCTRDFTKIPELNFFDPETLLRYAREAEQNQMYDWAVKYYRERIARNPSSSAYWLDFGVYYLGRNDLEQAATFLFGLVSAMQNFNEEATDFLEAAVSHDPKNPVLWVILGLFYETISNDIGVDMALNEARRLDEGDEQEIVSSPKSESNDNLLTNQRQSSNVLSDGSQNDERINKLSKESTNDEILEESVDNFKITLNEFDKESNRSIIIGDAIKDDVDRTNEIKTRKSRYSKAPKSGTKISTDIQCESTLIPSTVCEKPSKMSLFIRTAEFLLDKNMYSFASMALAHELIAQKKELEYQTITYEPQTLISNSVPNLQLQTDTNTPIQTQSSSDNQNPTNFSTAGLSTITNRISSTNILFHRVSEYHLLCARLSMNSYKQDLSEAEFNASLIIEADPEAVEAWACLGHLRYIAGDLNAARSCYERCLCLITWPPKDQHILLLRLGSIYLQQLKVC
ncbi:unnamed protein product [Schistosoma margrebowiei]|uniref:Uncharacterized protein n=1 Tax=Schistosoma margrebowiei TaxID=48269 RepID=A0A183MME8_9TREM|nr:unnamed protein product [Schistosoma margrebowiei]